MPSPSSFCSETQPAPFPPQAEVAAMTLAELRSAGLVVEVYSALLGDHFLLASDGVEAPPEEHRAWYSVSEMEGLLTLEPEELELIHAVKCRLRCKMTVAA